MIRKVVDRDSAHLWMRENLRFSRYDINFMENVARFLADNRSLTIKQNNLWEHIVHKYRKQIYAESNGIFSEELFLDLAWQNSPVDFDPSYAPLLWIEDNQIYLKFPFNKSTIKNLKDMLSECNHDGIFVGSDSFRWQRTQRRWAGQVRPALVRDLYEFCLTNQIDIDPSVQTLADGIIGDKNNWIPTAEMYGNGYIVSNINDGLLNSLPENTISLDSIHNLIGLGVDIGKTLFDYMIHNYGSQLGHFASCRVITMREDEIDVLNQWIKLTNNVTWAVASKDIGLEVMVNKDMAMNSGWYISSTNMLDKGIDCLIYREESMYDIPVFDSLCSSAKKIVIIAKNETNDTLE